MIETLPFTPEWLMPASQLLAQRHQVDSLARPELPSQFSDPLAARVALEAASRRPNSSQFIACSEGQLAGYLIGDHLIDNIWGRSAWVRFAGCALAAGAPADTIGRLYAQLGAQWVQEGIFTHFAITPVSQPIMVGAWFALGFGIEQVHALISLENLNSEPPSWPDGIEIRRAGPDDEAILAELSDIIWRHQVQAPIWGIMLPESVPEDRDSWAQLAHDKSVTVWLAFDHGQPVACQGFFASEGFDDEMLSPDQCCYLTIAGTRPQARRRGIGRALTQHGLAQARRDGYRFCLTNWRSTNLQATHFWSNQGFQPVAYRLTRRIDNRIAWANGSGK